MMSSIEEDGCRKYCCCFFFFFFQPCGKRSKGECFLDGVHLYSSHDCSPTSPPLPPRPRRSARSRVEVKTEAADKTDTGERGEWKEGEERALPDRRAQCLILSSVLPALIASTWMWSPARRCRPPAQTEPCESFFPLC